MPKSPKMDAHDEQFEAAWDDPKQPELPDMPETTPITELEIEQMLAQHEELTTLKAGLPMLYTARGNIIRKGSVVVTGKNFSELSNRINAVKNMWGSMIIIATAEYSLILSSATSDALRKHNQIDALVLAGWTLRAVQEIPNG